MKRLWTIIGVADVARSFRWYQTLLGQPPTAPAHPDFARVVDADDTVLLCLHEWAVEDHPTLMSPENGTAGNGLLLFFRVDDFAAALERARALEPGLAEGPHVNPNTRTREFSLRDPDGYYVTISARSRCESGPEGAYDARRVGGWAARKAFSWPPALAGAPCRRYGSRVVHSRTGGPSHEPSRQS